MGAEISDGVASGSALMVMSALAVEVRVMIVTVVLVHDVWAAFRIVYMAKQGGRGRGDALQRHHHNRQQEREFSAPSRHKRVQSIRHLRSLQSVTPEARARSVGISLKNISRRYSRDAVPRGFGRAGDTGGGRGKSRD